MFVICALYGFYIGFSNGIIGTVFSVLSIGFGIIAALKFAPATTDFLNTTFNSHNPLMYLAGLLLSFVLVMVLIRMFAKGLEGILKTGGVNIVNQIMGGCLVAAIMILIFSVLVKFGIQARMVDKKTRIESKTYPFIEPFPAQVYEVAGKLTPVFKDFWDNSMDVMDRLEDLSVKKEESHEFHDLSDDETED